MDLQRILRTAETLVNVGQVARRFRGGDGPRHVADGLPQSDDAVGPPSRLFGEVETRLAGVLVAALKEAFDRDRTHIEMERSQLEYERRRAEELTRLEWLRLAGERHLAHVRSTVTLILVVWVTSAAFMVLRGTMGGPAGLSLLALGWALLLGALASALVLSRHVSGLLERGEREPIEAAALGRHAVTPVMTWLVVLGLACTAASLVVSMAG
jgi:hypothetical protein